MDVTLSRQPDVPIVAPSLSTAAAIGAGAALLILTPAALLVGLIAGNIVFPALGSGSMGAALGPQGTSLPQ
jgi:hypothetical protein